MAVPNEELTPMRRQYYQIKEKNQDCLLFFRLGDFYEMFANDAIELGYTSRQIEALEKHGVIKGCLLTAWRILRCNPFSKGGYDPVPPLKSGNKTE